MKKGDYITDGEITRKVLAVIDGDLIGLSYDWEIKDEEHYKQIRQNEFCQFRPKQSLENSGWKVVEKEWRPEDLKKGDKYWYISDWGVATNPTVWDNDKTDLYRLKTKNIYKDKESAEEALKKIME